MKVLVVAPKNSAKIFSVGLAYVVSALKGSGHRVDCINLNVTSKLEIPAGAYDVVATGGLACHYWDIERILGTAKAAGAKTVIGGGIVSSEPELMTKELKPDFSVIGEGEVTVCRLLECMASNHDPSEIPGLAFEKDGEFVLTQQPDPIKDLNALPFPDFEALGYVQHLDHLKPSDLYSLDYFDYPRGYPIVASRSCPFPCTFCYHPLGKVYRQRSIDSIIDEVKQVVYKYRINVLEILDELFSVDNERLTEFCARLNEFRATLPWDLKWGCQLRVANITPETLQMISAAGCYNISLGIESYSQDVLRSMKKSISPDEIHRAVHCVMDTDIRLQGNFIFGDVAETMATARETLAFWKDHAHSGILLTFVQPYPDSELYRYCLRKGIIKDKLDFIKNHFFDILNMTEMPEDDFFRLRMEVLRHDFAYNKYSIPSKVEPDRVTLVCPHCREQIVYSNYEMVEQNSLLFSLRQNSYLFNRMMYCRSCGRRFWARSVLAQLFTLMVVYLLRFPSLAIKVMSVRNWFFGVISNRSLFPKSAPSSSPLENSAS